MGLLPLEFTDGLTDSPYFRETLQAHERELDRTNIAIKHLIKDIKDLILAARNLSRAQRTLSETLSNFNFECIGTSQTDDEMVIANSFKDFGRLLSTIEDERDRLLEKADEAFLDPIERFRRDQIGSAKEAKKKFDKETAKHCQNLEKYLNTSIKKGENQLQEADANYGLEQYSFFKAMSEYVLKVQEVNERKKFEFVETVLSFMLGWLTFYHQGHEIATDFYSVKMELQMRLQRTRNNFNMTQEETKSLRQKMLNNSEKFKQDHGSFNKMYTRQGYLFLMEKKAFTTSWTKHFCQYDKPSRRLTMIQYTQTTGKILSTEEIIVKECIRRNTDLIDRRFCFDVITDSGHSLTGPNGSLGNSANHVTNGSHDNVYTYQALSEEDFKLWFESLEGKERKESTFKSGKAMSIKAGAGEAGGRGPGGLAEKDVYHLDEEGLFFLRKCIQTIEGKSLELKGIYRIVGVTSKVRQLMEQFAEKRQESLLRRRKDSSTDASGGAGSSQSSESSDTELFSLDIDSDEVDIKTVTSALKSYLRNLNEPLMTFQYHSSFIAAAKLENRVMRMERIHLLVHKLPPLNFKVLQLLIEHLQKVSKLHDKNLMTSSNLGVCFGPTLLRTAEESVAAILDIKFVNVIAELLIENYEKIFLTKPAVVDEGVYSVDSMKGFANSPDSDLQQRPLPHVPASSLYGTSGMANNKGASYSLLGQQQQMNRYGQNSLPHSATARAGYPNSVSGEPYGRLLLVPQNQFIRRSSSNDQLYSVIPAMQRRPNQAQLYNSHNLPLAHLQHSQSRQLANYSAIPHLVAQGNQRKPLHLTASSPSPSSASTPSAFFSQASPGQTTANHIYQSPFLLKNAAAMGNASSPQSSSAIYGQLRSPLQSNLQPSMSYQNLHYNSEIASAMNDMSLLAHPNSVYTRPMTSIGILPHSGSTGNRTDSDKVYATSVLSPPSQLPPQSLLGLNANSLQPRQLNLSSTSSASLPSTPEHSQQPSNFPYRTHPPLQSPTTAKHTLTPPPTMEGVFETAQESHYGPLYSSPQVQPGQPPELYGTVGHPTQATLRSPMTTMAPASIPQQSQQSPTTLPSTKVRTRYVCIGGSQQELSFQPNMIISNVRSSREPGWIEGNLNGKTGLIPLNYVEFIN